MNQLEVGLAGTSLCSTSTRLSSGHNAACLERWLCQNDLQQCARICSLEEDVVKIPPEWEMGQCCLFISC